MADAGHLASAERVSWGTILLAEDNPMALETIAEYLTENGYRVVAAGNGAEATGFILNGNQTGALKRRS